MRTADAVRHVDEYVDELRYGLQVARYAGVTAEETDAEVVDTHGDENSIVTIADRRSDRVMREFLMREFPSYGIVTEEGEDIQGYPFWAGDPIDGTTNFSRELEYWSTVLGLYEEDGPVVSIVHSPGEALGRTYFAVRGEGAYLLEDGSIEKLEVNEEQLSGSIVIPKFADFYEGELEQDIDLNRELVEEGANIRVLNSGALENCLVAQGTASGFISAIEGVWDSVTASLIVEEAGGETRVRDTHQDNPEWEENREIVTSNGVVQEQLEDLAEQHLE